MLQHSAETMPKPNMFKCTNVYLTEDNPPHVHNPAKQNLALAVSVGMTARAEGLLDSETQQQYLKLLTLAAGHMYGYKAVDGLVTDLQAAKSEPEFIQALEKLGDAYTQY